MVVIVVLIDDGSNWIALDIAVVTGSTRYRPVIVCSGFRIRVDNVVDTGWTRYRPVLDWIG